MIATMTALVLGLVAASAQDSFTKVGAAVEHTAADVVALGPKTPLSGADSPRVMPATACKSKS